jgi:hypothetical protein
MELGDSLKGARSDLIKTCATQLGIALDLYWNDQAEVEQYEKRMTQAEQTRYEAEAVVKMMNGAPKNPVFLVSRAQKDFGMSLQDILNISKTDEDALFDMDEEQIEKVWDKVSKVGKAGEE